MVVFRLIKNVYWRYMGDIDKIYDLTLIGKLEFLNCYAKARNNALILTNIKASFKGAGIWPISRKRALQSQHILLRDSSTTFEKSNPKTPKKKYIYNTKIIFKTPQKSSDIFNMLRTIDGSMLSSKRLMLSLSHSIGKHLNY